MRKPDLARKIARHSRISQARAADELDGVVHTILANLRKGQDAPLPGLGTFSPGPNGRVTFEREKGGRSAHE